MNNQKVEITLIVLEGFKKFGFKSVTMDDLAREAGVSKKTIYELFKDKDELVMECVKLMLTRNQEETNLAFSKNKNAVEQLMSILNIMEKLIRGMNVVGYLDLQRYFPKAFKYLQDYKSNYMNNCIAENLKQGIKEGYFREDIDVDIVSKFRMESALIIFQGNVFPASEYDIIKVNNQLFATYVYGIATIAGHKLISKYLTSKTK